MSSPAQSDRALRCVSTKCCTRVQKAEHQEYSHHQSASFEVYACTIDDVGEPGAVLGFEAASAAGRDALNANAPSPPLLPAALTLPCSEPSPSLSCLLSERRRSRRSVVANDRGFGAGGGGAGLKRLTTSRRTAPVGAPETALPPAVDVPVATGASRALWRAGAPGSSSEGCTLARFCPRRVDAGGASGGFLRAQ